jgi:hypothetical protein
MSFDNNRDCFASIPKYHRLCPICSHKFWAATDFSATLRPSTDQRQAATQMFNTITVFEVLMRVEFPQGR